MPTAVDAWTQNLQRKVDELRSLLLSYLTTRDNQTGEEIDAKLDALKLMFGHELSPTVVGQCQEALHAFRAQTEDEQVFLNLFRFYDRLSSAASFTEGDAALFEEIFEAYKKDETLNKLVDELVALLQKVLDEGDEVLTAQIARELETVLKHIKKRPRMSLFEMMVWLEFSFPALMMILAQNPNLAELIIVGQAARKAFELKQKLYDLYKEAKSKLIAAHKLTYIEKALSRPELTSDEQTQKLLKSAEQRQDSREVPGSR